MITLCFINVTIVINGRRTLWVDLFLVLRIGTHYNVHHSILYHHIYHNYRLNEFMAVGHVMYDVALVELVRTSSIDRIVLQRAPCSTKDLCRGVGTWKSFFEGFYRIVLAMSHRRIPVYLRFWDDLYWTAFYRNSASNSLSTDLLKVEKVRILNIV